MVREMKEVLQVLGWGDTFRIPIANQENKQLEQTVEELLKRKAGLIVGVETLCERKETLQRNLKSTRDDQSFNQRLLNSMSNQLNNEITLLKDAEVNQKKQISEIKKMKTLIAENDFKFENLMAVCSSNTKKISALKESLLWGHDALFAWEEELVKGEKKNDFLELLKQQDDERFQKLELERQKVEVELMESRELERNEADRCRILRLQLENVTKLYKEAYHEKERLMKVWHESVNLCYAREGEHKRLAEELCEINVKTRNRCKKMFEDKRFGDELGKINMNIKKEKSTYYSQYEKLKECSRELEKALNHFNLEKQLLKKTAGHTNGQVEMQRMKNTELQNKNKARLLKYNRIVEAIKNLQQEYDVLKVDDMTNEQKYRNAYSMYEMSCKASEEESREINRLYVFATQLRQEISELREKEAITKRDGQYLKTFQKELLKKLKVTQTSLEEVENQLSILMAEDTVLNQQIIEIKDKCLGRKEKEEIEAKIKKLEPQEASLQKENTLVRMRLRNLQKEYRDKLVLLRNGDEEISAISDLYKVQKMKLHTERKKIEEMHEELQKKRLLLNLLLMKEHYAKENIAKQDRMVSKLEKHRIILENAMNERKKEIEIQKETLAAKKRSLLEQNSMLGRTLEHLNLRIGQLQAKYTQELNMLGKDESGKQLTIAHFKIQLAQEKYELQLKGDDLEQKINKTEKEILAMENTLKLLSSANENYKTTLETGNKDDPEALERELLEKKYSALSRLLKDDMKLLESVKKEIERLSIDIRDVKTMAKDLEEDWRIKEKEVTFIEKDLANRQLKLERASTVLLKLLKELRRVKEQLLQKKLAMIDIDIKIQDERNRSVLQQLGELITSYVETKPIVNRYLNEYVLKLPSKFGSNRRILSNQQMDSARSKASLKSDSSVPSIVNFDPLEILSNGSLSSTRKKPG